MLLESLFRAVVPSRYSESLFRVVAMSRRSESSFRAVVPSRRAAGACRFVGFVGYCFGAAPAGLALAACAAADAATFYYNW